MCVDTAMSMEILLCPPSPYLSLSSRSQHLPLPVKKTKNKSVQKQVYTHCLLTSHLAVYILSATGMVVIIHLCVCVRNAMWCPRLPIY